MKKYIFTESQVKKIIDGQLNEQSESYKKTIAVQKFLNDRIGAKLVPDGKTGPNSSTEKAIIKYQTMIGVLPTDGVWGPETEEMMEKKDKNGVKIWKKYWSNSLLGSLFN